MKRHHPALRALCAALLLLATTAHAEGLAGSVSLSSNRVERGVSQSGGSASLGADLEWAHRAGFYAGLGAATVDEEEYGGARLRWAPRVGWRWRFGTDERPTQFTLGLSGQLYPGAQGTGSVTLPPRLAASGLQAQRTDYGTAELNLALSHAGFTLALDRSLTDYQGIATESPQTVAGQRVLKKAQGSSGSLHLSLSYRHEFDGGAAAWAGVERQTVANFQELDSTGWRLGGSLTAWGLVWALEAHASNANPDYWRVQPSSGNSRSLASRGTSASVTWEF